MEGAHGDIRLVMAECGAEFTGPVGAVVDVSRVVKRARGRVGGAIDVGVRHHQIVAGRIAFVEACVVCDEKATLDPAFGMERTGSANVRHPLAHELRVPHRGGVSKAGIHARLIKARPAACARHGGVPETAAARSLFKGGRALVEIIVIIGGVGRRAVCHGGLDGPFYRREKELVFIRSRRGGPPVPARIIIGGYISPIVGKPVAVTVNAAQTGDCIFDITIQALELVGLPGPLVVFKGFHDELLAYVNANAVEAAIQVHE